MLACGTSVLAIRQRSATAKYVLEDDPHEDGEWKSKSWETRARLNMLPTFAPWTDGGFRTDGVPPSYRMIDCINVSWGSRKKSKRNGPWYLDLSQCISRCQGRPTLNCLTTGSLVFDFECQQLLTPSELLATHGTYFKGMDTNASAENARKGVMKVGGGMFCSDLAVILMAVFLNEKGPYHHS